jgi:hypothetical protein
MQESVNDLDSFSAVTNQLLLTAEHFADRHQNLMSLGESVSILQLNHFSLLLLRQNKRDFFSTFPNILANG